MQRCLPASESALSLGRSETVCSRNERTVCGHHGFQRSNMCANHSNGIRCNPKQTRLKLHTAFGRFIEKLFSERGNIRAAKNDQGIVNPGAAVLAY